MNLPPEVQAIDKKYFTGKIKATSAVSGKPIILKPAHLWKALFMLATGETNKEVGLYLRVSESWVRNFFNNFVAALGAVKETREQIKKGKGKVLGLITRNQHGVPVNPMPSRAQLESNPEMLNAPFRALLSPPGKELNEAEIRFCWSYVASNSYEEALTASGLDVGLYRSTKAPNGKIKFHKLEAYNTLAQLRISAMKSRPEIHKFIAQVREEAVFNVDVDKDFLQKEILIQLDSLKTFNTLEGKKLLHNYLQMLGKTFGGFTDKLELGNIDHTAVLKKIKDHSTKSESIGEAIVRKMKEKEAEENGSENQLVN